MTSRARLSRRPLQVGGLLLATVALGTVTAPAASAMVDPNAPADPTPEQAPAPAPVVLTNSPASYLGSPAQPVYFGMGKVQISVAPEPGVDAPEDEDLSGAQVQVTFPADLDDELEEWTATCTTDSAGHCDFPVDPESPFDSTDLVVAGTRAFTVTVVKAPSSQVFDIPAGDDDVVHGRGGADPLGSVDNLAPGTSAADPGRGGEPDMPGSIVFYLPLAQLSGGQPGDPSVAPGAPAPDPVAEAAPVVPVVPSAATPAAAPTLATTGFDAVPAALVGGGLLVAGAGAVAAGRRRAAR